MNSKKQKSYQERLKRMKECIDKSEEILDSEFPDDVTIIGNPDFLEKMDDEIEDNSTEESDDDKQKGS